MFFICWAPFHAQRLLYVYAQGSDYYPDLNEWLYILSGCLYYFSTTVNPILYNVMSMKYRQAFKQTICCRTRRTASGISMGKEPHLCRCDSTREAHDRSLMCSVRYECQVRNSPNRWFTPLVKYWGELRVVEIVSLKLRKYCKLVQRRFRRIIAYSNGKCSYTCQRFSVRFAPNILREYT